MSCAKYGAQINLLHGVVCEILGNDVTTYTSHTWLQPAATNLAGAGVSFINLKRYGQWILDSVVEGYIANSKPLRDERLHRLMQSDMRLKNMTEEERVIEKNEEGSKKPECAAPSEIIEIDNTVDVGKPSPDNEPKQDLTLIIFTFNFGH